MGFALLCTTSDDKLLCIFEIVNMLTKLQQTKNKERFLKIFKIKYVFIYYTIQVKMKRKVMIVVKNKIK